MKETAQLANSLEKLQQNLFDFVDGLSTGQWEWKPTPREFSIAQCVYHMNTVNGLVVPRIEEAVHRGAEQNLRANGPFRYPIFDRLFVFALEPRAPLKQQSPEMYRPAQAAPGLDETRRRFAGLQLRLIACTYGAEGLDLVRIKIASPVSDWLRFSLGTWLAASLAHEENHFAQAQRLREHSQFPV